MKSNMIIKCIPTGMLSSNCYILGDGDEGVIIDSGADKRDIIKVVGDTGQKIKHIILTHAHLDHICSVNEVREELDAKVLIHKADADALKDNFQNGSVLFGLSKTFREADVLLNHGDVISVGSLNLEVIHTPGHTPGGICIKVEDCVFTGDTLFKCSIGRTDLGNGNYEHIIDSIQNRIMKFDEKVVIYPGHGGSSTIGYEKRYNPFI